MILINCINVDNTTNDDDDNDNHDNSNNTTTTTTTTTNNNNNDTANTNHARLRQELMHLRHEAAFEAPLAGRNIVHGNPL